MSTQIILKSLKNAEPSPVHVSFLTGFFWHLFAVVGVQAFKLSFRRQCVWNGTVDGSIFKPTSTTSPSAADTWTPLLELSCTRSTQMARMERLPKANCVGKAPSVWSICHCTMAVMPYIKPGGSMQAMKASKLTYHVVLSTQILY
jgi:hypothetical protein